VTGSRKKKKKETLLALLLVMNYKLRKSHSRRGWVPNYSLYILVLKVRSQNEGASNFSCTIRECGSTLYL